MFFWSQVRFLQVHYFLLVWFLDNFMINFDLDYTLSKINKEVLLPSLDIDTQIRETIL